METHCPHCNARYALDDEVLAVCGGEVRCFQCERVFNVLEIEAGDQIKEDKDPAADHTVDPVTAQAEHPVVELRHDPGVSSGAAPAEKSHPIPPKKPRPAPQATDRTHPEPTPFDLSDSDTEKPRHRVFGLVGTLLVAALSLAALLQLAWIERDQLLANPTLRPLLTKLGDQLGIPLPAEFNPRRFKVLRREMAPDTEQKGALRLHAVARNESLLTQPLPDLQLTLFDTAQNIVARRTFRPAQYLSPAAQTQPIAPQQTFDLELLLKDPGDRASGFELAFY